MIVKMVKYDIVLLEAERDAFMERLRELGMVDLTVAGWEPSDEERSLVQEIDSLTKASHALSAFASGNDYSGNAESVGKGSVYSTYRDCVNERASIDADIEKMRKTVEEWTPWGTFSASRLKLLSDSDVKFHFYVTSVRQFDDNVAEWGNLGTLFEIARDERDVRFVSVGPLSAAIDATELRFPELGVDEARLRIAECEKAISLINLRLSACSDAVGEIDVRIATLKEQLQNMKVSSTAEHAADDRILVIEGWAEKETSEVVDKTLDSISGVYFIKSEPTPEDNTPVKLKNNRFASLFELIGSMYALPKYGTVDLTPFFAPFYMLFFAICLNDAGYGLVIFLLGLFLSRKGPKLKQAAYLSMFCGGATMLFGFYTGALFGISIPEDILGYDSIADSPFLDFQNQFFSLALAIGVVQILLGMAINIWFTSSTFGLKHALGSLGWFLLVLSGSLAAGLPMLSESLTIPWFTVSSPAFLGVAGLGLVFMFFFNSPDKNIFANFGLGLWDTYNNITGILSDVLSYIRLFAIGLSGGVLALVFNALATGLSGLDGAAGPWWTFIPKVLIAAVIIVMGQGINLFMSAISSFVHPMRLTFVEFYKNAGFEMAARKFEPVKKEK